MAQKAKWQSFYTSGSNNNSFMGMSRPEVAGVWDQYSNVYYGEARTKEQFLKPLVNDLKILNEYINPSKDNRANYNGFGLINSQESKVRSILNVPSSGFLNYNQPSGKDLMTLAQEKYLELNTQYEKINTAEYKYQDMMQESVRQYGKGWGDYFEANYRNPRMAEEQRQTAQMKTDQYKARVEEANNKAQLTSANQLEIQAPREVNTGVGSGKDTQINQLINNGGTGLGL